jgi:PKD repeat protein
MQARINNGCLGSCSQGPPLVSAFTWTPEPGCVGQPVQFTDQSTGIITAWAWTFAGGTPPTSNQQNPAVVFTSPGPHQVTLLITGTSGNTNAHAETITTDPLPISNYTYTVDDLTMYFTNTSQNATSYYWDFGDGFDSFEQDPVHTYSVAGTYLVTLTATSHCGSVTRTYTVTTAPAAMFSAEPTSGCATLQVNMVNESSSNAVTYQWSFPGGAPAASNQPEPTVYYSVPGVYSITLVAFNSSGSSTFTRTSYITVSTIPAPGFNFTSTGLAVSFNNTSVNGTSYLWEFGDGTTSTLQNPTHTYANGGTYTVKLTTTNACGSTSITKTVSLIPAPEASFTTSGSPGCAPQTVTFTNTSIGATSFNWSFPGATPPASTDTSPVVVYDQPGTYTATLVAINTSGTDTATATIQIGTVPGAGFSSSTSGLIATFTNSTTNGTSYSWDFGDGSTSTETDPTHSYTADEVYTVVLTATNACGSSTVTQTVTITTPPSANFTAGPLTGCPGMTVVYDNTSSDNATTFAWSFPGGTPDTSSLENPAVVYNTSGQYDVTLIASNSAGADTVVFVNYIQVGSAPVAGFSSTSNGAVVSFTNSSTNATSYSWDFGDNSGSSEANPVHTYAADGVYTVVLSATNSCGTVTTTQTVTVTTAPSANFTAGNTSGCGPLQVIFENTSSENVTSWFWTFEGGEPATSTDENPTVIYLNPGTYDVTLVVTGSGGSDTLVRADYITVEGAPSGSFTYSQVQNSVSFTNTTAGATTYTWTFGDGNSSNEANPTHTYAADGIYTVILAATNDCGTTFVEQTVTIVTVPVAAFTFNGAIGCSPFIVLFDNTSSDNATSIEWTFEGGTPATSTEENPLVTWDAPGVYTVTLVASNSAGSSTATASITVTGGPTAGFTSQTAGLSVIFNNSSQNGGTYDWDFGDGTTSQEENPTHTYAATGTYTVVLTAYNECGTNTFTQVVTIEGSAPLVSFSSDAQKGCAGVTIQFTDQSAGDPTAWQWIFEGGTPATSNEQNPSVTYTTPGVYPVTLQATNIYGSSTSTQPGYVTIIGAPVAGFDYSAVLGTISFTSTSQGADAYSWNFGDGTTSNEASPVHTYSTSGSYTVTLTVTNDCGAATLEQTINVITVGVQDVPWLRDFEVYPNPGAGLFTVELIGEPQRELEVALYNALGQRLRSEVVDFSSGSLTKVLDYSSLPSAGYTLRITGAGASQNVRLVIQK